MIIDGEKILPGENKIVEIEAGKLPSGNSIAIHVHIYRALKDGPILLVQGGLHGDEINGIEIVRRAIADGCFNNLKCGSVIAIPLLNVYGFINFSRSVPDGKDVNRSFPGHSNGSLASRTARKLTKHILPYVDYAIDYHTGGASRYNWPQIRYSTGDKKAKQLAEIFGANCSIQKPVIKQSFREIANKMNIPALVYEGGESIRFDSDCIRIGIKGMHHIMDHLGLIHQKQTSEKKHLFIQKTSWIRATHSGVFIWEKKSGDHVEKGTVLGCIYDTYGSMSVQVLSSKKGILIGHNNASVVNQGDALFNIGML